MNNIEKFLPLGTVCLLKDAKKKIMVIGYLPMSIDENKEEKLYDYMGCIYPEGIISTDKSLLFNHQDIEKVFYIGYKDDELKEFNKKLIDTLENYNNMN